MNAATAGVSIIIDHSAWSADVNFLYLQDCNLGIPVIIPFRYTYIYKD